MLAFCFERFALLKCELRRDGVLKRLGEIGEHAATLVRDLHVGVEREIDQHVEAAAAPEAGVAAGPSTVPRPPNACASGPSAR